MPERYRSDRLPPLAAPMNVRVFEGRAARIHNLGDALRYRRADGTYREEHRDRAELERVVAQLVGKPVCLMHPDLSPENRYGVVADGAQADIIGKIIGARIDGDYAIAEIALTQEHGVAAVEEGIRELSLTYQCDLDESGYQRNTEVDHLAVLPRGRCGGTCAVRADACSCNEPAVVQECACKGLANPLDVGQPATHMPLASDSDKDKALMDELQKKLAEAQAEAAAQKMRADQAEKDLAAERLRADNAEKDLRTAPDKNRADSAEAALQTRKSEYEAAVAALEQSKIDALAAQQAEFDKKHADAVTDRINLIDLAKPIIGADKDVEGKALDLVRMTPRDIKVRVIQRVDGDDYSDTKQYDDSYVSGMFAGAVKRHARVAQTRADVEKDVGVMLEKNDEKSPEPDTGPAAEKRGTDKMRNSMSSAWKTAQKDKE